MWFLEKTVKTVKKLPLVANICSLPPANIEEKDLLETTKVSCNYHPSIYDNKLLNTPHTTRMYEPNHAEQNVRDFEWTFFLFIFHRLFMSLNLSLFTAAPVPHLFFLHSHYGTFLLSLSVWHLIFHLISEEINTF